MLWCMFNDKPDYPQWNTAWVDVLALAYTSARLGKTIIPAIAEFNATEK